jgi:hypothetical protein
MEEDEVFVFIISIVLAFVGIGVNTTFRLHRLNFRGNPAPGIVRAGIITAMGWIAFVLWRYADPSVTGVYVLFYLVMGYAVVKLAGQSMAASYGLRTRVDAGERRNPAVALVLAAFILATGLIFGGSLWGEADAVGDDEGGWWIPAAFFLLGWATLLIAFGLFLAREKGRLVVRLHRERSLADARAAGAFLLSSAVVLTDAVAGDFWGWRHGLFSFGLIAVLLLVHEAFAGLTKRELPTTRESRIDPRRIAESTAYLVLAVLAWSASRFVDATWGGG